MSNKIALITGGNRGIGLAVVKIFLKKGYGVVVVARKNDRKAYNKDAKIKLIDFDLKNIDDIPKLARKVGKIDVLVNNAAVFHAMDYQNYTKQAKIETLKVNLEAPAELIRAFCEGMAEMGGGRVVNVASIAGEIGHSDIWYGAAKAGLINLTKSFARTLTGKKIIVNAVAPGPVETEILQRIPKARLKTLTEQTYQKRPATPEEVAEVIYWLGDTSPDYINGVCIDINNGAYSK